MDDGTGAYFNTLAPGPRRVALALREAVLRAGPELTEKLSHGYPSWHGRDWVISVIGHSAHCNLQLVLGAELAAQFPDRIEGSGKSLRHVKVRSEDEIDGELEDIIDAAIALDATSAPRPARAKPRRKG